MQASIRKVMIGALFFAVSCVIAVVGYWLSGWSVIEAIYMVTITVFGVGYGEIRPIREPGLQAFTIFVIIAGCTSAIYVMGGFVQMIAEGELNRFLGARRMTRGIDKLDRHVIVCGYGRVGRQLVQELRESGEELVIIDTNQQRLQEAENSGLFVILGDATDDGVLESAGIQKARLLASVLSDDASNVFITLTARELNAEIDIIARGESASTEKKLLRSGANRVVLPAVIGASRIARLITRPSVDELLSSTAHQHLFGEELRQIGLRVTEIAIAEKSEFVGQRIADVSFGEKIQFVLVGIRTSGGEVQQEPPADYRLGAGDTLILLTHSGNELAIQKAAQPPEIIYRGARA